MGEAAHAGGKDFGWYDEGGAVRTEIKEELQESKTDEFASNTDMIVPACKNGENQRLEMDLLVLYNAITH